MRLRFGAPLMFLVLAGVSIRSGAADPQTDRAIEAPRFWNDRELADWATPVAGLNVRPGHFSEREYYAAPNAEWVRTYPVYVAGREPAGYWEMLREKKPEPLIAPSARTTADWVASGKRVFEEMDLPAFRSTDPQLIAIARSAEEYARRGGRAQPDGRAFGLRWVPTSKGLAISVSDCSICHTRVMPDGTFLNGAPFNVELDGVIGELATRGTAVFFPGDSTSIGTWRQYTVPWIRGDIHEALKSMSDTEIGGLARAIPPGVFARFNGSVYYPTKVPDLIGIKDRKYIDHTGTHRLRGPSDAMRYAALVSCCCSSR